MDGHKETIGLAETQRESSCSSVGRVELNETELSSSLPVLNGYLTEKRRWRHQQNPHKQPSMIQWRHYFNLT